MMPYISILNVGKVHLPTTNRFITKRKKGGGGGGALCWLKNSTILGYFMTKIVKDSSFVKKQIW